MGAIGIGLYLVFVVLLGGCGGRAAASADEEIAANDQAATVTNSTIATSAFVAGVTPTPTITPTATLTPTAAVTSIMRGLSPDSPLSPPGDATLMQPPAASETETTEQQAAVAAAVQRVTQRTRMGFLAPLPVLPLVRDPAQLEEMTELNLPTLQSDLDVLPGDSVVDGQMEEGGAGQSESSDAEIGGQNVPELPLTRVAQSATALSEGLAGSLPTPTPTANPLSLAELLAQPVPQGGSSAEPGMTPTPVAMESPPAPEPPVEEAPHMEPSQPALPPLAPTPAWAAGQDGEKRTVRVPIFMYHYLSTPPPGADAIRTDLSVAPERFAAHLDALQANGYTTISLHQLYTHLNHGAPLPEKPVILTFDDGYRDNYENAFPLLRERGMTATFFIVTDFINDGVPAYLTWDMVREMYAGGMSIEAHGRNHVSLKGRDVDFLVWQALGNREAIELATGVPPRFISYPAGQYDQRTIDIYASAHFWGGVTTIQGATHTTDMGFEMRRVRVRNTTTAEELLRLAGLEW